ncbi:MAG: DUF6027 family protein [Ilumatobacteraceae bacterium]
MADSTAPTVELAIWDGPWPDDDPDANFKSDVALYSRLDPLSTISNLGRSIDVPVGALCRYVLAKWASAGAEALMALGPTAVTRLWETVDEAERAGTDDARLAAYERLRAQISWLRAGFEA